ncbi:hypothetical protein [Streptomyces sp. TR06-5]|uniref:hypothetical protein n=1 Tax=Streptomyces sp. TR06-5 TaxID=3385976 RepID=UPI00399F2EF1
MNSEKHSKFPKVLCGTKISTRSLQGMYLGPYSEVLMVPADKGEVEDLGKRNGGNQGMCDVWIAQEKGDAFTIARVVVELHPQKSVEDMFQRYEIWYPDDRQQSLTLGAARGFTMYYASLLVSDCQRSKKRPSMERPLGVSVRVILPRYPSGPDVDRAKLAKGAGALAADTARYVSSDVLRCSAPDLPEGAPVQKAPQKM